MSGEKLSAVSGCRVKIGRKCVQIWHVPAQVHQTSRHKGRLATFCLDGVSANQKKEGKSPRV